MSIGSQETATSQWSWPVYSRLFSCDLGRLVANLSRAIAMRMHEAYLAIRNGVGRSVLVSRGGREGRMTPGIKRLDHEAWLSLLALSVPIHDGKSHPTRMSASVRVDTEGRCAPGAVGEKDQMGSQVRGPRGGAFASKSLCDTPGILKGGDAMSGTRSTKKTSAQRLSASQRWAWWPRPPAHSPPVCTH